MKLKNKIFFISIVFYFVLMLIIMSKQAITLFYSTGTVVTSNNYKSEDILFLDKKFFHDTKYIKDPSSTYTPSKEKKHKYDTQESTNFEKSVATLETNDALLDQDITTHFDNSSSVPICPLKESLNGTSCTLPSEENTPIKHDTEDIETDNPLNTIPTTIDDQQINDILQETMEDTEQPDVESEKNALSRASPHNRDNPQASTQEQLVSTVDLPSKNISIPKKITKKLGNSAKKVSSSVAEAVIGIPGFPLYALNLHGQRDDNPHPNDSGENMHNHSSGSGENNGAPGGGEADGDENEDSHHHSNDGSKDKNNSGEDEQTLVGATGGSSPTPSDEFTRLGGPSDEQPSDDFEHIGPPSNGPLSEPWQKIIVVYTQDGNTPPHSEDKNQQIKNKSDNDSEEEEEEEDSHKPQPLKDPSELGQNNWLTEQPKKSDMSMGIPGPGDDTPHSLKDFSKEYQHQYRHHHHHHHHRSHHQQQKSKKQTKETQDSYEDLPGPLMDEHELSQMPLGSKGPLKEEKDKQENEKQDSEPYHRSPKSPGNSFEKIKKPSYHRNSSSDSLWRGNIDETIDGEKHPNHNEEHSQENNKHDGSRTGSLTSQPPSANNSHQQKKSLESNEHSSKGQNQHPRGDEHRGPLSTSRGMSSNGSDFIRLGSSGSGSDSEYDKLPDAPPGLGVTQDSYSKDEKNNQHSNSDGFSSIEVIGHSMVPMGSNGNQSTGSPRGSMSGSNEGNGEETSSTHHSMHNSNEMDPKDSHTDDNSRSNNSEDDSGDEADEEDNSSDTDDDFDFENGRKFDHFSSESNDSLLEDYGIVEHDGNGNVEESPFKPRLYGLPNGSSSGEPSGLLLPPPLSDSSQQSPSGSKQNEEEDISPWDSNSDYDTRSHKTLLVQNNGHPHHPDKKNNQNEHTPSDNQNETVDSNSTEELCITSYNSSYSSSSSKSEDESPLDIYTENGDGHNDHQVNQSDHSRPHSSQSTASNNGKRSSRFRTISVGSSGSSIIVLKEGNSGEESIQYSASEDNKKQCLDRECKRRSSSNSNSNSNSSDSEGRYSFEVLGSSATSMMFLQANGEDTNKPSSQRGSNTNNHTSLLTMIGDGEGHHADSSDEIDFPQKDEHSHSDSLSVSDANEHTSKEENGDNYSNLESHTDTDSLPDAPQNDDIEWPPNNNSDSDGDDDIDQSDGSSSNSNNGAGGSENGKSGDDSDGIEWPSNEDSHHEDEPNDETDHVLVNNNREDHLEELPEPDDLHNKKKGQQYRQLLGLGTVPQTRSSPGGDPKKLGSAVRKTLSKSLRETKALIAKTQAKRPPTPGLDSYRNAFKALTQAIHTIAQSSQQTMRSLALAATTGYPDTTKRFRVFGSASTKKPYPKKHQPYGLTVGMIVNPVSAFNIGAAYTYTQHTTQDFHVSNPDEFFEGSATGKLQTNHVSLLAAWNPEGYGLISFIEYAHGMGHAKLIRKFTYDDQALTAKGKTRTHTDGGTARIGYRFKVTDTIAITPYGEVAAVRARWNDYTENKGKLPAKISSTKEFVREERLGVEARWKVLDNCQIYTWGAYISSKKKNGEGIDGLLYVDNQPEKITVSKYTKKQSMGEIGAAITIRATENFGISFNASMRTKPHSKVGLDSQYVGTSVWYAF